MLEHYALPALMSTNSRAVIVSKNLRVFGLGEGLTAEKLDDLLQGSNPTAATYALQNECFVRVTARASNEEEALTMMQPLIEKSGPGLAHIYIPKKTGVWKKPLSMLLCAVT